MKINDSRNTIYYVCQWGHDRARAWSGTYLALFKALKKQSNLIDIGVKQKKITRIKQILNRHTKFIKYDFSYDDFKNFDPWKKKLIPQDNVDVFSYFELNIPPKSRGYVYQDMCIDYIDNVILKDELLAGCFRKNVSHKVINIRKARQKEYYSKCTGIFVMGEWLKKYMVEKMGVSEEKIHCVGAGFDVDTKKYDPSKRQGNKILFIGVDFERKGGPLVIEAFKILREKYQKNAELYIVGPKVLNVQDGIEGINYIGNISGDRVFEYYNLCDSFCMPSYLEPFGKVFVEALAYGMPVIARNAFAAPDFIVDGKNGFLIENDDAEVLAKKMYDSLHNESIREYVKNDMTRVRDYYSWDNVAERICKVIGTHAHK